MAYGSATTVQQLLYGSAKAATPDIVTAALQQATTVINILLNRNEDFSTVPQIITDVANTIAHEICRDPLRYDKMKMIELAKYLLGEFMNQSADSETRWGSVYYT